MNRAKQTLESGFTLIELLTVISLIGILSLLAIQSLNIYKSNAAYSVAEKTLKDGKISLEAGIIDPDNPPPPVALTTQNVQGQILNAGAKAAMPGMQIPKNVKLSVAADPNCTASGCIAEFLQIDHCQSQDFVRWTRFGDGVEVQLNHVAGSNCS